VMQSHLDRSLRRQSRSPAARRANGVAEAQAIDRSGVEVVLAVRRGRGTAGDETRPAMRLVLTASVPSATRIGSSGHDRNIELRTHRHFERRRMRRQAREDRMRMIEGEPTV